MARKRITVQQLAREAGMDVDETLIALWDAGFDRIVGPDDVLHRGNTSRARRALGLATRRELGSPEYWKTTLSLSDAQFNDLLLDLGLSEPYDGSRLRKKAIHRLASEVASRGLTQRTESASPSGENVVPEPEVESAFLWEKVGRERDVRYLGENELLRIHEALAEDFASDSDPISPVGARSEALLSSAAHRPQTSLGGERKYPTVEMAAAALLHSIVHNHPFHNGNKRTALVAMLVFLDENGLVLTCNEDHLFKLVLQLAQHALAPPGRELADREVLAVARWLANSCRWVERGDRAVPWRRLRQILKAYGCHFEFPKGAGNRINISREVEGRARFFGRKPVRLSTQSHYGDEGREVQANSVAMIRRDLKLDDDNGIDSMAFYDNAPVSAGEFIVKYRKTLRRLAKL